MENCFQLEVSGYENEMKVMKSDKDFFCISRLKAEIKT